MHVEVAKRGRERIWIVDRERARAAVIDLEPVVQRQLSSIDDTLEHAAGMDLLELDTRAIVEQRFAPSVMTDGYEHVYRRVAGHE